MTPSEHRWWRVCTRAREVAKATGYKGTIVGLILQALEVYDELLAMPMEREKDALGRVFKLRPVRGPKARTGAPGVRNQGAGICQGPRE